MKLFDIFGDLLINDKASSTIKDVGDKADGLGSKLIGGLGTAAKWGAGIVAAGTAAGAALFGVSVSAADALGDIDDMSQKLGLSTKAFQEWDYILKMNGTSIENMSGGIKTLTQRMEESVSETGEGYEAFKKLGIAVTDNNGELKSQEEIFSATIEALQGVSNQTEKASLATTLLGRSGQELMPLLNSEKGSIQELAQEAHNLGLILSEETIQSGAEFGDNLDKMKSSLATVKNEIGVALMPVFNEFLNFILKHMPTIKCVVSDVFLAIQSVVELFVKVLNKGFGAISKLFKSTEKDGEEHFNFFLKGWKNLEIIFLEVVKGIVKGYVYVLKALNEFYKAHPELFEEIGKLWENIKNTVVDAAKFMWDSLKKFWEEYGEDIKKIGKNTWNLIKEDFEDLTKFITKTFSAFNKVFQGDWSGAWNDIVDAVEVVRANLEKKFDILFEWLFEVVPKWWQKIKDESEKWAEDSKEAIVLIWEEAWNAVVDGVKDLWTNIKKYLDETLANIKNWLKNLPSELKEAGENIVIGLGDGIRNATGKAVDATLGLGNGIVGSFKDFFDIHSPSKLMQTMGWYLGEGVALGIKSTENTNKTATKELGKNIVSGFESGTGNIVEKAIVIGEKIIDEIENMQDDIRKGGKKTSKSIAEGIEEGKTDVENATKTLTEKTTDIVSKAAEKSKDLFGAMFGSFGKMVEEAKKNTGEWKDTFSQAFDKIGGTANTVYDGIKAGTQAIAQAFAGDWAGAVSTVISSWDTFSALADKIFGGLFKKRKTEVQRLRETWAEQLEEMEGDLKEFATTIGDLTVRAVKDVTKELRGLYSYMYAQYNGYMGNISTIANESLEAQAQATQFLKDSLVTISEILAYTFGNLEEKFKEPIDQYQNAIESVIKYTRDLALQAAVYADDVSAESIEAISKMVDGAFEAIEPVIEEFRKLTATEADKLGSAVITALENMYNEQEKLEKENIENQLANSSELTDEKRKELEQQLTDVENKYNALREADALESEALKMATAETQDEIIELLETYNPKWQDVGQSFGEKLVEGLNSEKQTITDAVNDILKKVDLAQTAIAEMEQAQNVANVAAEAARQVEAVERQQAQTQQLQVAGVGQGGQPIYVNITTPEPLSAEEILRQLSLISTQLAMEM